MEESANVVRAMTPHERGAAMIATLASHEHGAKEEVEK